MIYIVTLGEFSDYGLLGALQREREPDQDEAERIQQAFDELNAKWTADAPGGSFSRAWVRTLVERFGFAPCASREIHGGVLRDVSD